MRSQGATNIVAQKYFGVQRTAPACELSLKQMLGRVAATSADGRRALVRFGKHGGAFKVELTYIPLHLLAHVNWPGWFNFRCEEQPQCSA